MTVPFRKCLGIAILVCLSLFQTAYANVEPACVQKDVPGAKKLGGGPFRWFGLKIYDTVLWGSPSAAVLDYKKDAFCLELTYARSFEGVKIAEKSKDEIENQGIGNAALRDKWEKQLANAFPNVDKGTRLAGAYIPNVGVKFYRDDKEVAMINDPELAKAFFAIWLDTKTSSPSLRNRLLGLTTE